MTDEKWMKPSEVFALRVRETRKARGLSLAALSRELEARDVRISKAVLHRIETCERGLLLDEALALASTLNAVPADLLSPPEGALVATTPKSAMDSGGIREWLRYGLWNWTPAPDEGHEDGRRAHFQQTLATLSLALLDAVRQKSDAGTRDAVSAISREVVRRHKELGGAEAIESSDV
jgi:hypothetical protein